MITNLQRMQHFFSIGNQTVENVQQFTYLYQVITKIVCWTEHRAERATAKFLDLHNILTGNTVNMHIRRKLLEAVLYLGWHTENKLGIQMRNS